MIFPSKGLMANEINNYLDKEDVPQVLKSLWEFSKLEDKDMWTKDTTPAEVINYIFANLLINLPDHYGIGIFNRDVFYTRLMLRDPTEEPFDIEWIWQMDKHQRLFKTAVSHLMKAGCCDFRDYGIDDYLLDNAAENIEYYSDKENYDENEIGSAREMIKNVGIEQGFFLQCDVLADKYPIDRFKRSYKRIKDLPNCYCRWLECVIDIAKAGISLDHLDTYGYESFDNDNGNAMPSSNFIMTIGLGGIWEEVKTYTNSIVMEVGYTPGLQVSPTLEFEDYTLFEKLLTLNDECTEYSEELQRSKS